MCWQRGVGVGTLTLLQSDSLDSYRAIPASAQDSTRLEHSLATLAEQLNQQLRERDGESKTILSAYLPLIQDDEFAGNIRRLMTEQHQGAGGGDHQQYGAGLRQTFLPLPAIICANVLATFAISANSCCISPGRN